MEKNTLWAIILSTIVLVGFMTAQSILYPNSLRTNQPAKSSEQTAAATEVTGTSAENAENGVTVTNDVSNSENESLAEETYTITTNKVKVTFTNRGGDVIGYELLEHNDTETGKGVEMADNISASNRAFSLSLGGAKSAIINDLFTAKVIDEYTIGFFKHFTITNADGSQGKFTLVKTYSFKPDDYVFKLDVTVDGGEGFAGLNVNDAAYTLRTSPQIGPHFDRKVDRYENRTFISYNGEKAKKIVLGTNQFKSYDKNWTWTGLGGKYFVILTNPINPSVMAQSVSYSSQTEVNDYANAQLFMSRLPVGGTKASDSYYVYIGPRSEKELKKYNIATNNSWGLEGKHYNESLQTSGILNWLETILKFFMELLFKVIPNWGVSIIILTALLKFAMFPLTAKSAMGTLKMQQLSPRMQEVQAKYKDNPQKMQQETAKLYREIGYNPLSGCLPLLFQFVILWAMYNLFNNYFEFRGASFIPGWIPDLSRGDEVATLKFNLPLLGNHIRLLPVIYVISQLLFGKITGNGGTAAAGTSQSQMKMMMYGMPLVFFFIFYNAPSGLLLYWTVSNVIQIGQQMVINKTMKAKVLAEIPAKAVARGGKKNKR